MKRISMLAFVVLAACGSTAVPPTTAPMAHDDHVHHHDMAMDAGVGEARTAPTDAIAAAEPDLLAMETAAWEKAQPMFEKYCAACHTTTGKKKSAKKLDHFNMDTYPLAGHHAATIGFTIRDVLGLSGKKPTMPSDKPGSVQGEELAAVKAWTDAWEVAENAGKHPHHGHGHGHDDDDDDDHDHDHHE